MRVCRTENIFTTAFKVSKFLVWNKIDMSNQYRRKRCQFKNVDNVKIVRETTVDLIGCSLKKYKSTIKFHETLKFAYDIF